MAVVTTAWQPLTDNAVDLGASTFRFKDFYTVDAFINNLGQNLNVNGFDLTTATNLSLLGLGTSGLGFIIDNPSTTATHESFLQLIVDSANRTAGGSWKMAMTEQDHNLVFYNDAVVSDTFVSKFSITSLGAGAFATSVTSTYGFRVYNNEVFTGTTVNSLIYGILDNASGSGTLAYLKNDGAGLVLDLQKSGSAGIAANITQSTDEVGLSIDSAATTAAKYVVNFQSGGVGRFFIEPQGDIYLTPYTDKNVLIKGVGTSGVGLFINNPSTTDTHEALLQLMVDTTARTAGGAWKMSMTEQDHDLVFWNDSSVVDTFVSKMSITSAGAFSVTGSLQVAATTVISSILDEDTLVSDSATALATQQSIKAYVDTQGLVSFFNGTMIEPLDATVSESGGTVTLSVEQSGGGDLTMVFSDGNAILDTDPTPATIALTPGTDTTPVGNYIYVPISTKVLTKNTTGFPTTEHIKIAYVLLQSAATTNTEDALINQNWNDYQAGVNNQGHLSHVTEHLRLASRGAAWNSGVNPTITIGTVGAAPDTIDLSTTAGVVYQLHEHVVLATDTAVSDNVHVVNYPTAYTVVTDLADIVTDSLGGSLTGRYYNLVLWGVANKTGEASHMMINVPNGSYNSSAGATGDTQGYDVYDAPLEYVNESGTAFLIARFTFRHQAASGGTATLIETVDLRGKPPGSNVGGGGIADLVEFPANLFRILDSTDPTKEMAFSAAGITTGTTRTLTIPDLDGTILTYASSVIDVLANVITSTTGGLVLTPLTATNVSVYGAGTSGVGLIIDNPSTTNTHEALLTFVVDSTARTAGGSWKISLTEVDHNLVFWNDDTTPDTFVSKFSLTSLGSAFFTSIVTATSGFSVSNNETFTGTGTNSLLDFSLTDGSSTGGLVYMNHAGTGQSLVLVSATEIQVAVGLTGDSLTSGRMLDISTANTGYTGVNGLLRVTVSSGSASGIAFRVQQSGTGEAAYLHTLSTGTGLFIDVDGNAIGLNIDSEATTANVAQITNEGSGGSIYFPAGFQNIEYQDPASSAEYACGYTEHVTTGVTTAVGDVLYYNGTNYVFADADAIATATGLVMALEVVASASCLVCHIAAGGKIYLNTWTDITAATGLVYLSVTATSTHTLTFTPPSGGTDIVMPIGYKRGANLLVLGQPAWTEVV